ncbi:hypothetical protein [Nocardia sp. BMG51109]|nr:hypothetical protein [Nocardia sp. BMG51109]
MSETSTTVYIAWATGESGDDGLREALTRWFGSARITTTALG